MKQINTEYLGSNGYIILNIYIRYLNMLSSSK